MFIAIIFSRVHYPNFVLVRLNLVFSNSKYLAIAVSIYFIKVAKQTFLSFSFVHALECAYC